MGIKYNNYANVTAYRARRPMDMTNQILVANKLTLIRVQ